MARVDGRRLRRNWTDGEIDRVLEVAVREGATEAARLTGMPRTTICKKAYERGISLARSEIASKMDIGLEVLLAMQKPGVVLSLREIADVCEVSFQCVQQVEQRALRKLRWLIGEELRRDER